MTIEDSNFGLQSKAPPIQKKQTNVTAKLGKSMSNSNPRKSKQKHKVHTITMESSVPRITNFLNNEEIKEDESEDRSSL